MLGIPVFVGDIRLLSRFLLNYIGEAKAGSIAMSQGVTGLFVQSALEAAIFNCITVADELMSAQ